MNNYRETKVYLNCNPDVGLGDTQALAEGEIEGRLHYVSLMLLGRQPCDM